MERPIFHLRWERKALYRRKLKTKNPRLSCTCEQMIEVSMTGQTVYILVHE